MSTLLARFKDRAGIMNHLKRHVGLRVKSARRAAGMTQAELAERLDRAVETISNIERGQALPGLEMLAAIGEATKVSVIYFLEGFDRQRKISSSRQAQEQAALDAIRSLPDRQLALLMRLVRAVGET
jgi:transcriptional regulator with XRE-family HTH domain